MDTTPAHPRRFAAHWRDWPIFAKGAVVGAIPVVPLLVIAWLFFSTNEERRQADAAVTQTWERRTAISDVRSLLGELEVAVRAYALTREAALLNGKNAKQAELWGRLDDLERLIADDSEQIERTGSLRALVAERLRLLDETERETAAGDHRAAVAELVREGQQLGSNIRAHLANMGEREERLLRERRGHSSALRSRTAAVVLFGTIGGAAGAFIAAWIFMGRIVRRIDRATDDAQALGRGAALDAADHAHDEIGQLSQSLRRAAQLLADREEEVRARLAELANLNAELASREQSLRESESFLASVVDNIPHMVFVKDAGDLRFVRFNRAGEELLGVSREELLGRSDADLFPAEQAHWFTAYDRKVLSGTKVVDIEEEVVQTRHRGPRLLHTKKIPILDPDGTPRFLLGISEDVTEQRKAHEALARARAEAERASQAKNEFLSRMSHELRTPLNAVLGFAQLLQMDELPPAQADYVRQIVRGGQHLLDLIDEVLDIARIEAGKISLSPEPVSVPETVQHALHLIRPLADKQEVSLHGDTAAAGFPYVRADRQRLNQVFLNLLSNAVKYNRVGGRVDVRWTRAHGRVRVAVSDTGIGIPPERRERLFTPFDRLGAEQRGVEGTGLGLALSKRLVEAIGGSLDIESTLGKGTTVTVELEETQPPSAGRPATKETGPSAPEAQGGEVLYIEDNAANVRLMERILERRPGVRLLHAADGSTGLRLIEQRRPRLVLLDLHLPDIPGDQILQHVRGNDPEGRIAVAILSADATESQKRRLIALGASVYMSKPLNVAQVLDLIDSVLVRPRES